MLRQIDHEIERLRASILSMGRAVEQAIEETTLCLSERKPERIQRVRELEDTINRFHLSVDEQCLKIMASHAPLATDLRLILAILKINCDLERMGDQAMNAAYRVQDYLSKKPLAEESVIIAMGISVRKMVRDALNAFINDDVLLSESVLIQDDEVDAGKRSTLKCTLQLMKNDPACVEAAVDLLLISRNIERMGDHATNIAEDVIFASTGKDVRHAEEMANEL